jgi:hypothetical protein
MHCPLKAKLYQKAKLNLPSWADSRTLVSAALTDTYVKSCHMYAQKKPFSSKAKVEYFSKQWNAYKNRYTAAGGPLTRIHNQVVIAHEKILNMDNLIPDGWDFVLVSYPFDRVISGSTVSDRLDLVLVNKKDTTNVKLILLDPTVCEETDKDYGTQLRALFCLMYFKRELTSTPDLNVTCYVKNLYHGYERQLTLSASDRLAYRRVIKNVISSMEAGLYYPRASADACKHCLFKTQCSFSIS